MPLQPLQAPRDPSACCHKRGQQAGWTDYSSLLFLHGSLTSKLKIHDLLGNWSACQDFPRCAPAQSTLSRHWRLLCARLSLIIQRRIRCHMVSIVFQAQRRGRGTCSVLDGRTEIWNQGRDQSPWPNAQHLPSVADRKTELFSCLPLCAFPFCMLRALLPCLLHLLNIFKPDFSLGNRTLNDDQGELKEFNIN